ncbi:proteoglycan 4-like isoform X1 [Penaeus indicus]|uniref:proteoglycan 4-like isoform X1 n=1 Tax=Penaeus indicus TaxID=29960 RepID=UPI00300C582F
MKLLVVGLALLVGGAWAQHSFINRDTELLALPSDQLIHSDVELDAVESIVPPPQGNPANLNVYYATPDQLLFGARLPGYEKIDYAYGYQIRDNQGSKNVETLPTTTIRTTTEKASVLGSFHSLFFPDSLKQHLTPPDKEYLDPSPQSQSPKVDQPPVKSFLEVGDAYLPPDLGSKVEVPSPAAPSDQYLPPEPETKFEAITTPPPPSNEYLPPDFETKSEPTPTTLPPPADAYLPPDFETKSEPTPTTLPPPADAYLPPNIRSTELPPFLSEYLPPPPDPPASSNRGSLHPIPPTLLKPAAGAAWKVEQESPVGGDQPTLQPLGIQTAHNDAPVEFVGQYTPSPPLGVEGVPDDRVTAVKEETVKPPLGVVAAAEDPPLHFKAEAPAQLPVGAIGELKDEIIIADSEKTALPPISIVGDLGTNKIYFQSETAKLEPYAIISEIQPETIKFQSEVVHPPPLALVSELQKNSIRAYAEQPKPSPYAVVGEPVDNAIKAEAHSRPVVVGAIAKANPACEQNDNCADDQICMDGLCVNACVIATGLCVGHASCVARRHIPGCVCPDMFTAVTHSRSGQDQYDCMPMMMMAAGTSRRVQITAGRASNTGYGFAPIADHRRTDTRIRYPPLAILSKMLLLRPPSGTPSA